jgi:plasmid stabilization system protein ParE
VRLLVIPPYILEYEVTDSAIEILIVRHGRQDEAAENRLPEDQDPMEG